MLKTLLGLIVLGLISATLSYYNKNYYVGVFNDILGRDEDEKAVSRVGRGFLYGFFFPIYLALILIGLFFLVVFLIAAGIVAAIAFVLVWVTENILPHDWFGEWLLKLYRKIGLGEPAPSPTASQSIGSPAAPPSEPGASSSAPPAADAPAASMDEPQDKPGDAGINVTRTHRLD
jgi:hypothetical protein